MARCRCACYAAIVVCVVQKGAVGVPEMLVCEAGGLVPTPMMYYRSSLDKPCIAVLIDEEVDLAVI